MFVNISWENDISQKTIKKKFCERKTKDMQDADSATSPFCLVAAGAGAD